MQAGGFALGGAGSTAPPFASGSVNIVNPVSIKNPWDSPPFNGRVAIPIPPADANSAVPLPFANQWAYDPLTKNPNTWNWSLTLERNMGNNILFRGAYVGSRGTHIIGGFETNLPVFIPGQSTLANRQERRADPKFQAINISSGIADSYYHSMQLTAEKRYSGGLTFLVNYTLSKSIDTGSNDIGWAGGFGNQDPRGPSFNRGLSEFDRTHVVNASMVWDLPKVKSGPALLRHLANNWAVSSLVFIRSGNPFTPVSSKGNSLSPGHSSIDRADVVPGVSAQLDNVSRHDAINNGYFNQAAFTTTALGTRGNSGRSVLRGPGFSGTDFMLARFFPINERLRVQLRIESFNVFNQTNFNGIPGHGSPAFTDVDNKNFGKLLVNGALDPRIMQFGLKVLF